MDGVTEHGPTDPSEGPPGDALRDVPLFREIQRVLMASTGPVNWELARQVGIASAAWGADDPTPTEDERRSLEQTVRAAELAVADLTALPSPPDVARVELVRRAQWVESSIASLREVIEPVAARLTASLGDLQPGEGFPGLPGMPGALPGEGAEGGEMANQVLQMIGPLLMGVQAGTVLGALGQRVFGEYDLAVPRPGGTLSFVVANIAQFEREWELPRMEFRAWVALHEVSHRFEFAGAWTRDHFLELVRDLVANAEIDLSSLRERLESMDLSDPGAMSHGFEGVGNLFGDRPTAGSFPYRCTIHPAWSAQSRCSEGLTDPRHGVVKGLHQRDLAPAETVVLRFDLVEPTGSRVRSEKAAPLCGSHVAVVGGLDDRQGYRAQSLKRRVGLQSTSIVASGHRGARRHCPER